MENHKTWHEKYHEKLSFGDHVSDMVAKGMGSWKFIIIQTILVVLWMVLNIVGFIFHWDVYPFILLNLLFSTQAAYAAPIIMMSQNRQNIRDIIIIGGRLPNKQRCKNRNRRISFIVKVD